MKRHTLPAILLCAVLSLTASAAIAKEKTPPGSFLRYRATTVGELSAQISQDSVVRARYARHFGVAPEKVGAYIASGIKLVSLKSPMRVHTWYVDSKGRMEMKAKLLPKGSLVFAGADGKPILLWSCGNPLRTDLPWKEAKVDEKVASSVEEVQHPLTTNEPVTKVLAGPPEIVGVEPITAAPDFIPVAAAEPLVIAPTAAPSLGPAMPSFVPLAGLGALGGLVAVLGSNSTPPNVPEPSSMLALLTGASFASSMLIKARRRRR